MIYKLFGGRFDRHKAERAAKSLGLPYRKPAEWLSVHQTWKLLECDFRLIVEAIQSPGRRLKLDAVFCSFEEALGFDGIKEEGFLDSDHKLEDFETHYLSVHPDEVMKKVKQKQLFILRKEKQLVNKLKNL